MTAKDQLRELMLLYGENPNIDWDSLDENTASHMLDVILIKDKNEREKIIEQHLESEKKEREREHNNVNKLISDIIKFKNKVEEIKKIEKENKEIGDIEKEILIS